jgi:hypothetical protein
VALAGARQELDCCPSGGPGLKSRVLRKWKVLRPDKRAAVALYGLTAGADLANNAVGPAALTVIQPRTVGVTARFEF